MSFITRLFNFLKKTCCPFLATQQPQTLKSGSQDLEKELIERQKFTIKSPEKPLGPKIEHMVKSESLKQLHKVEVPSKQQSMTSSSKVHNSQTDNNKESLVSKQPLDIKIKKIESDNSECMSNSNSFQTVRSNISRPVSRRNFEFLPGKSRKRSKNRSESEQFYSIKNSESFGMSQTNNMYSVVGFDDEFADEAQGQIFSSWLQNQYQAYPSKMKINVSEIMKMKIEKKDYFDNLVHKLEDYYTFYYQQNENEPPSPGLMSKNQSSVQKYQAESVSNLSHSFVYVSPQKKNFTFECSLNVTDQSKSFDYERTCKYMSVVVITRCMVSPLDFVKWFNRQQIQAVFYNFHSLNYIPDSQNITQNLILDCPLIVADQFGLELRGKQKYVLARQMELVKFVDIPNEEFQSKQQTQDADLGESLLETCFEIRDEDMSFERLLRITAEGNDGCRVEIYSETSEEIKELTLHQQRQHDFTSSSTFFQNQTRKSEFSYFENLWKQFESRLIKDKIVGPMTAKNAFKN